MRLRSFAAISAGLVLLIGSANLWASGSSEDGGGDGSVTVTLVSERGSHTEAWKTQMEGFEATSGVHLDLTQFPYANYRDQLLLSYTSGSSDYDVPYVSLLWYPSFVTSGYIQPINEFLTRNPGIEKDMPGLASGTIDGNLYFVPYMNEVGGIVYRTDLFNDPAEQAAFRERYGYDLQPPANLEQYVDVAEFFNRPPELYGVSLMGTRSIFLATHFMNRLWAYGGELLDDEMRPVYNSELGVRALEEAAAMFDYASDASLTYDFQEALAEFSAGRSAMAEVWTTSMFAFNDPESSQVAGKCSFVGFPRPAGEEHEIRRRLFISWGFVVSSDIDNKDAALSWIEHAVQPNNLAAAAPVGTIPTRLSALEDAELIKEMPWIPAFREALAGCEPTPIAPLIPEGMTIVVNHVAVAVSEFIAGTGSAKELLDAAAEQTYELLEKNGYYE
ncbi:ABC transporter substrate-binding protein [Sediminispirochaeta smaragdinae]|uniref:Extracellular solute-binding protein family 1 n=1 Tax=Sediminispirochaeta smaragdinae (strain DSM 11293 / JCM 15392 / SEBR 4228) TaxID=573413 RepID=E1RAT6_SEDSS|nr:extracellular solute-binding protein [Sediminispirochaeta smaragdinae]ADK82454.1 extracellular solute-binding protein family 1 [Sediminispirochaeta smaragdinae DSM 11293]